MSKDGNATESFGKLPPWALPYNGWTWKERMAVVPIQQAALRRGEIKPPSKCRICGFEPTANARRPRRMIMHTERYDCPLEYLPLCQSCHAALHARFRDPHRWFALLARCEGGPEWAKILTMDPDSATRPFDETYPPALRSIIIDAALRSGDNGPASERGALHLL